MKKTLIVIAALLAFTATAVAAHNDFGVPPSQFNGIKNAVRSDGSLKPNAVGEYQLKNEIIGCEKLAKYLRPRVCGRLGLGAPGADGKNGANGAPGANGLQGALGAPGAKGADGPKGATGPTGPTGARGYHGRQGPKGDPGTDGKDGKDGVDGSLEGTGTLDVCLDGKGGINQAPCEGEQVLVHVVILKQD